MARASFGHATVVQASVTVELGVCLIAHTSRPCKSCTDLHFPRRLVSTSSSLLEMLQYDRFTMRSRLITSLRVAALCMVASGITTVALGADTPIVLGGAV